EIVQLDPPHPTIVGPQSLCISTSASYAATDSAGSGTFTWYVTGGAITGGVGTPRISVQWGSGSTGTIIVSELSSATGCTGRGDSILLSASRTNFAHYTWSTGETTPAILVKSSGAYSLDVIDENGCKATSNVVAVTINPLPAVPIITKHGDTLTSSPAFSYQ